MKSYIERLPKPITNPKRKLIRRCALTAIVGAALIAQCDVFAEDKISIRFGGVSTDILGGNGGSKAALQIGLSGCRKYLCYDATLWQITEPLDDDKGIVPENGYSLTITSPSKWRTGVHYTKIEDWRETYIAAGIGSRQGKLLLLIPSGNARFGMTTEINAPINSKWSLTARYDYLGRQDPDIKLSIVGFGLRRKF